MVIPIISVNQPNNKIMEAIVVLPRAIRCMKLGCHSPVRERISMLFSLIQSQRWRPSNHSIPVPINFAKKADVYQSPVKKMIVPSTKRGILFLPGKNKAPIAKQKTPIPIRFELCGISPWENRITYCKWRRIITTR